MKEASGEVSMTLIVIVAAAAILGIFTLLKPKIEGFINNKWDKFNTENGAIVIPVDSVIR